MRIVAILFFFLLFYPSWTFSQGSVTAKKKITYSSGQKFLAKQYTSDDGLSDKAVTDILQDKKGYVWVATEDGLNRFDGYEFRVFKYEPGDSTSLSDNKINDLYEDDKGQIWIGTESGLNVFDPITEKFKSFKYSNPNKSTVLQNRIQTIYEDNEGLLWLGTDRGLLKFDKQKETFQLYLHNKTHHRYWETEPSHEISALIDAEENQLIVGYWGMGFMLFDKQKETFSQIPVNQKLDTYALIISADLLVEGVDDIIWIIARGDLFRYEKGKGLIQVEAEEISPCVNLHNFIPTPSGQFLITGEEEHLNLIDKDYKKVDYSLALYDIEKLGQDKFQKIMLDLAGDIWLGTGKNGLFHLQAEGNYYSNYGTPVSWGKNANRPLITSMVEFDDDYILATSEGHGMIYFNKKTNSFEKTPSVVNYPKVPLHDIVSEAYKDRSDNIWFSCWHVGMSMYKPGIYKPQYFNSTYRIKTSLSDKYIKQILETREGEIWVATYNGLSVLFDQQAITEQKFVRFLPIEGDSSSLNHSQVNCLYQRQNGEVWVGTQDGLHRYDRNKKGFDIYRHNIALPNSIVSNSIHDIYEGQDQQLWIATSDGLEKFNDKENNFTHVHSGELLESAISSINEDLRGVLWLETKERGLVRYDPKSKRSKNITNTDGLANSRFFKNSFIHSKKTGKIYIGGGNRMSVFHPDSIHDNSFIPPVYINALEVYDAQKDKSNQVNLNELSENKSLELSYYENIITFQLSVLNFRKPNENQYAYKLAGFNDNWINIGNKRELTFTNLDPGSYTLLVKGANNDAIWNETATSLKITIHPPWWYSNIAYFIYTLLIGVIIYSIFHFLKRRWALQNELKLKQAETDRINELDQFKSKFYTNITHEFRTPLTVILGMADQIKEAPEKYLNEGVELISRNGKDLLQLINQMLDLSKLENSSFSLNMVQADIVAYLKYVTESFHSLANSKNLSLHFFSPIQSMEMDHDTEQLKQVMTNLIVNAIKYTYSGGEIKVRLEKEKETLLIEVKDTGIGIEEKDLLHVFDRFYQVETNDRRGVASQGEGTGIGLAHTYELVQLMGGEIWVESDVTEGTSFFVRLPMLKNAPFQVQNKNEFNNELHFPKILEPEVKENVSAFITQNKERPRLLLIEDNYDVVTYLKTCLTDQYDLDIAYNGRIGIEKAIENIPDLIISDVMMPEKDGFEVCDTLKNDERTSHIPIILLTAKADAASKIAGLKRGADAYLSKPFDKEELLVRLQMLVKRQNNLVNYFSQKNGIPIIDLEAIEQAEESVQVEHVFIQKVNSILEEHFGNEGFGLPQLCQKIGMSRSQLFRKMKALTDTAPSTFIKNYRLEKARYLLENTEMNVAEVTYEVGFKDPSYFSKMFLERYGVLPSLTAK